MSQPDFPVLRPEAEPAAPAALVAMRNVSKRFGPLLANDDVTLEILPGETLGLLGENGAGKSTLMKVLFGLYRPDGGSIEVKGRARRIGTPREALALGIGMVHQHFMLVPDMTVAENVALGLDAGFLRGARLDRVSQRLTELSERYGLAVASDRMVEELSVGEKQRVEILKVLYRGAEILILDEPTAVLSPPEWRHLLRIIETLTGEGKAVVLISHKLGEICEAADRCVVLRDGGVVGTVGADAMNTRALARLMVGRDVDLRVERPRVQPGEVLLEVADLCATDAEGRTVVDHVGFELRGGEVLGVAGVDGNGQRELVDLLTGLMAPDSGTIRIGERTAAAWTPADVIAAGGAAIPEERQRSGTVLELSVSDNLLLRRFAAAPFSRRGILQRRPAREHARRLIDAFDIRAGSSEDELRRLSGGNQQKVVLARELAREPRLLIAAQPTRGLDVGAMEFVYTTINDHKRRGGATLLVSTELDEVLTLADRVSVMYEGSLSEAIETERADAETIGLLMAGRSL